MFETASKLQYGDSQILRMQQYLKQAQDYCVGRFEGVSSEYERRLEESQKALKKSSVTDEERQISTAAYRTRGHSKARRM